MATRSYPRIGYAPYRNDLAHPGDLRRFVGYARARSLPFEIARPDERYDLVVLSELADFSVWCEYAGAKLVYDLIDSYLAVPRTQPIQLLRGLAWYAKGQNRHLRLDFKGAVQSMCRRADAVVCTTDAQKQDISAYCANVHIVLDVHDSVVLSRKRDYRAGQPFQLIWEGLPSNLYQLGEVATALRQVAHNRPLVLNVITDPDRPAALPFMPTVSSFATARKYFDSVKFHKWDAATLAAMVTQCDVAIIPVRLRDPLTRGKPGNKLALLWRLGMPVITSATPAYLSMQEAAGLAQFACRDEAAWVDALETLIADEAIRQDAGERGHRYVADNLTTENILQRWDRVFASIGFDFASNPS